MRCWSPRWIGSKTQRLTKIIQSQSHDGHPYSILGVTVDLRLSLAAAAPPHFASYRNHLIQNTNIELYVLECWSSPELNHAFVDHSKTVPCRLKFRSL
ncbi:hypothetical protein OIU76_007572 [Salix suchowensis]|nr:hypothetical protein OIU76_007572 [Salix suchowensis]